MIPEKNLVIYRHSDQSFTITLYLRNRELTFEKYKDIFIGEEIAFGSWWQYSSKDTKLIFDKLNLSVYVDQVPIGELTRLEFDGSNVDWDSLLRIDSYC